MDALKLYGQFRVWSMVIVTVCVACSFCAFGGYLLTHPDKHTSKTSGKTRNMVCEAGPKCTGSVDYSVNSKPYSVLQAQWNKSVANGQTVDVYYRPDQPSDGTVNPAPKELGPGLMSAGACMILCAVIIGFGFSQLGNRGKAGVGGVTAASDAYSVFLSD